MHDELRLPIRDTALRGLGVGATLHEAAKICRWRAERRRPAWALLDYLQLGFYAHETVPAGLRETIREQGLEVVVHLLEIDLLRPLDQQRDRIGPLAGMIDALDPVCVEEDLGLWCWDRMELEGHMLPPILDRAVARTIAHNVAALQASFGVPFWIENPPIYFGVGELDLLTFLADIAERARCGVVLDIGHLVGYCAVTGRDPFEYLDRWDGFAAVRELHLAGFELRADVTGVPMWYDDHSRPLDDYGVELAAFARARSGRALPLTLEQDGADIGLILQHIERMNARLSA